MSDPCGLVPGVDRDEFWALVERSSSQEGPEGRAEWLTRRLTKLPAAEIEDFQEHVDELHDRADRWVLWGAAWLVCGGLCSDDGFWYFQAWLVGQGRVVFDLVTADPDALAEVPAVRALAGRSSGHWAEAEWPDWESLDYVAEEAYEKVTGADDLEDVLEKRRGSVFRAWPEPADDRFEFDDEAEMARRYPKLMAMFPTKR